MFDKRLRDIDKTLKLSSERRAHEVEPPPLAGEAQAPEGAAVVLAQQHLEDGRQGARRRAMHGAQGHGRGTGRRVAATMVTSPSGKEARAAPECSDTRLRK